MSNTYETFFNIIRVPAGKEEETLAAWQAISDYMEAAPGCIATKLHRNRQDPHRLINYARFTDMPAFMQLTQDSEFTRLSQVLTDLGVEREAGVFDVLSSFGEID